MALKSKLLLTAECNIILPVCYRQFLAGRKAVKQGKRRLQEEIKNLEALVESEKRIKEKYKKRWHHLAVGTKLPCSTVDALLHNQGINNSIRKRLLLHESIIQEIRNNFKNSRKDRER